MKKVMLHHSLSWLNKCSGAIDDAIDITRYWCWCQWHWHYQKSHVACQFLHLDLAHGMVSLITLLASWDTDPRITSIKWPKKVIFTFFQMSWPKEYSVLLTVILASHDTDGNVKWLKKSCCILFPSSWPWKWNGAIDDTNTDITLKKVLGSLI